MKLLPELVKAQWSGTPPKFEHRFDPERRWRFDFAWPEYFIAVEVDGGAWTRGRHTRGKGFIADCEKLNAAVLAGWKVLRFTPQQIERGEWTWPVVLLMNADTSDDDA